MPKVSYIALRDPNVRYRNVTIRQLRTLIKDTYAQVCSKESKQVKAKIREAFDLTQRDSINSFFQRQQDHQNLLINANYPITDFGFVKHSLEPLRDSSLLSRAVVKFENRPSAEQMKDNLKTDITAAHKKAVATLEIDNERNQVAFSTIDSVVANCQDDVTTLRQDNLQLQRKIEEL